jgi:endonuclease/exonuclease/phosphatase family metal-dependent hydrolase
MADFSEAEWRQINDKLDVDPGDYGMPVRRSNSVVLASWNIRKFGSLLDSKNRPSRTDGAWNLIEEFCAKCDFIAIQEVQDSLECLLELRKRLGAKYRVVVTDIAGGVPGRRSSRERLAFVYNSKRIEKTEMSSDISFERSAVFQQLYDNREQFAEAFERREKELKEWNDENVLRVAAGKRKRSKPPFVLPHFVQFIRTPQITSFEILARDTAENYKFAAINAHLLYGDKSKQKVERELEFKALLAWLIDRSRERERAYAKNMILFGDLNLDFEKVDIRRAAISKFITELNAKQLKGAPAKVNFPFIDQHPSQAGVFRTNARQNQTYDQIAIFADDDRLPPSSQNSLAGNDGANNFDFGMFDFVRLFFDTFPAMATMPKRSRYSKFEYDVSDHMPIWIRLPRPFVGQPEFDWSL